MVTDMTSHHNSGAWDLGCSRDSKSSCVLTRVVQGAIFALGAPLGWLLTRVIAGHAVSAELSTNWSVYVYMFAISALAFIFFGMMSVSREQRLERLNRKLERMSFTDSLTGLRNVRYFWERVDEDVLVAHEENMPLSLIVFDLDHFKRVNDTYGHAVGDQVLRGLGGIVRHCVRRGDTAARVGGEEFALVLPGTNRTHALQVITRIREVLADREFVSADGERFHVTLSAGVVSTQERRGDARQLFDLADAALYRAKEAGRDRVHFA